MDQDGPQDAWHERLTAARAAGWSTEVLAPSTFVALGGPRPPKLDRVGDWRVFGDFFSRAPKTAWRGDDVFPEQAIRLGWGRYAAVRLDSSGRACAAVRDPSGALECLIWRHEGMTFVASETPAWLFDRRPPPWRMNRDRMAAALADPLMLHGEPLLDGLGALAPGTAQYWPLERPVRTLWTPSEFVRRPDRRTGEEAAEVLRSTLADTVSVLAEAVGPAAAEVSGGLDSSLVAACLAGAPGADVQAWINVHGPDREADERAYAQALGAFLEVEPRFVARQEGRIEASDLMAMSSGLRPGQNGMDMSNDIDLAGVWKALGIQAVFTGKGGDALLIQALGGRVFTDAWRDNQWRALRAAPGVARWSGRSIWSLVEEARRGSVSGSVERLNLGTSRDSGRRHPWLTGLEDLGPAKRAQIGGLVDGLGFHQPCRQTTVVDLIHPLLSQPVVELCLRLPALTLTEGRRDRSLARRAFASRLPPTVLERRWKGDLSTYFGRMIEGGLDVVRPLLLEGVLAEEGLIDRSRTEAALERESLVWRGGYAEIMTAVMIEAWARSWRGRLG